VKAAIYHSFGGPITVEQVPDPSPPDTGVVLKVLATGLCLSDWHGWQGHDSDITLPHVPGHELAGEIVDLGRSVSNWQIGDRVTLPFVCGCGSCPTCHQGDPQVCPNQFQPGFTHWGSFAEYVAIHYADANLVTIPEEIDSVTAASLGCRFATSFRGVMDQGRVKQGETVAVFGCGGVGLSAIMIARAQGARVLAIDTKSAALDKAKAIGANDLLLVNQPVTLVDEILELTNGGVDVTVDAIGNSEVIKTSMLSLKRRGRHVQIGLLSPTTRNTDVPMDRIIAYELELLGSHGMAATRYSDMMTMIKTRALKPQLLIDQTITLEEGTRSLLELDKYAGSGIRVIDSF